MEAINADPVLQNIKAEYTPRASPQYNGRVEKRLADLWRATRCNLNGAKLPDHLRGPLWPAAAQYSEQVHNSMILPSRGNKGSSYEVFHKGQWPPMRYLQPFGMLGVVKTAKEHQSKLANRGTVMLNTGHAPDHAKDVCRMFNPDTKRFVVTRDIKWLNMMWADWKNLSDPSNVLSDEYLVSTSPSKPGDEEGSTRPTKAPPPDENDNDWVSVKKAEPVTKKAPEPVPVKQPFQSPLKAQPNSRLSHEMKNLATFYNLDAKDFVERNQALGSTDSGGREGTVQNNFPVQATASAPPVTAPDPVPSTVSTTETTQAAPDQASLALLGIASQAMAVRPNQVRFEDVDIGLSGSAIDPEQLDPSQYKDAFTNPASFEEAWHHPEPFQRKKWREAINKELNKMFDRNVWVPYKLRDVPRDKRLVQSKWVIEIKRNGIFRARLVAKGFTQVGGSDFDQIFSPMVNDITFRLMLVIKIVFGLDSCLFDVETAFLLGDLEGIEIYMRLPKGMEGDPREDCVKLCKTIYGLTQSSRAFFKLWANTMESLGFKQSPADPCLFSRGMGDKLLILCIYVDDGYILGKKPEIKQFFKELRATGIKITTEESTDDYLSCEVKFNKDGTKAWLGQPHLIKKLEKTFGEKVANMKVTPTPGTPGKGLVRPKPDAEVLTPKDQSEFRSGTGMLLYLVKHSRPDIANAVRELTKVMDRADDTHRKEMLRVVKHVLDTKNWGLKICPTILHKLIWKMIMWSDSDWGADKDNRLSVSGMALFVNGVLVAWRSKQQKAVALSSSEAELVAASEAVKEVLFVLQVLNSVGIQVETPVTVRVDNMGAIFMAENASSSSRTRHIDIRWHFTRNLTKDKVIEIIFCKSAENKSDGFTKNVTTEIHEKHRSDFVFDKSEIED